MASILLEGSRASNAKLSETGFRFTHATLEGALRAALNRS
jgi:NAD dependent epimerase/dehydratase family enzyme